MAISIMLYHLTYWLFHPLGSDSLLGRLGIYGVSIFFILSGLSMGIVYSRFIKDFQTSILFMIRRICRIWPLLWVCIGLLLLPDIIAGYNNIRPLKIIINITTLFGFIRPGAYMNTGAWSIGNEMVYYALTPVIILLYENKKLYGDIVFILSFVIMIIFAFGLLDQNRTLSEQWNVYINPFNNLFLYVSGISIYYNLKDVSFAKINVIIGFMVSVIVFACFPIKGDAILLVTGIYRVLFVASSIIIVISFYKFSSFAGIPKVLSTPLEQFGLATYGVYMFHPLVYSYLGRLFRKVGISYPLFLFAATVLFTFVIALASYNLFEVRVTRFGKKLTSPGGNLLSSYGGA